MKKEHSDSLKPQNQPRRMLSDNTQNRPIPMSRRVLIYFPRSQHCSIALKGGTEFTIIQNLNEILTKQIDQNLLMR